MRSESIVKYYGAISNEVDRAYGLATEARRRGLDPCDEVEISRANNVAEKVVGLISIVAPQIKNSGIIKRISELEETYGAQDWRVAFKIAEELAKGNFCEFKNKLELMEVGLRVGLAYITNGVVSSPLEGFIRLELKKRRDGKEYFCLYFGGPIRSAGTTAVCAFVALSDYVRKMMGYMEYDPLRDEVKRCSTEVNYFHERVTNLQYLPSEKELEFLTERLPVQIDGDPSEKLEVPNYKDLSRVSTNTLRNGYCLVMGEGLAQKGKKFWGVFSKWYKDFGMDHWGFMEEFIEIQKKIRSGDEIKKGLGKIAPDYNYIKDLVAGRPVLGFPLRKGGFRLRYGRSRVSGLSSMSMHPSTMHLLNNYIATGTQLRYERPGKSSAMAPCDSIEGPIVKLKNGDVLFLDDVELAKRVSKDVEEIVYMGDMLVNYGEFLNRAHILVPPGYCEEWWLQELKKGNVDVDKNVSFDEAYALSVKCGVALHPRYTYHWGSLEVKQVLSLIDWMAHAVFKDEKIIFPLLYDVEKDLIDVDPKRALELLGVPHMVINQEYVVVEGGWAKALRCCFSGYKKKFNVDSLLRKFNKNKSVLEIINDLSEVKIRDKDGLYIGARMGRPEKAKLRKMTGDPHVLFPVGKEGGRFRSFQSALEKGKIKAQFSVYKCKKCDKETVYRVCDCGERAREIWHCKSCGRGKEYCEHKPLGYEQIELDIKGYVKKAKSLSGMEVLPDLIKGVRGTSNKSHIPENLVKGILRAKYSLHVNKDGTIRYDMTEMPMTAFYPREIGTSFKKLKEMGYETDIYGGELVSDDQLVELKPSDIVLPASEESLNEGSDKVLFRIGSFVDELLKKLYSIEPYYNFKSKDDLIGHLVIGLAPHISASIVGRIIGFSKTQCCFAHPLWHSAVRRDCFSYDAILPIYNGDSWQNVKIGEFVESLNPQKFVDGYGTLEAEVEGLSTLAYNIKTKKMDIMPIKWFTKHSPSDIVRIKIEDGREICVTKDHKFYVYKDSRIIEKRVNELVNDDLLIVPYSFSIPQRDVREINLEFLYKEKDDVMIRNVDSNVKRIIHKYGINEITSKLNLNRKRLSNYINRDSYPLPLLIKILELDCKKLDDLSKNRMLAIKRNFLNFKTKILLNADVLEVVGLYLAEGFARKKVGGKGCYQVDFAIRDKGIRKKVKNVFKKYFCEGIVPYENKDRLTFSSKIVYEFFIDILKAGRNAKEKRIPSIFLSLPKKRLAHILKGYYEGDGSVSLGDLRVSCDTVSAGLIYDLEFVLARFGIYVRKYKYKKEPGPKVRQFYINKKRRIPKFAITKLTIPSNFCSLYFNNIGFISRRKQNILKKIIKNINPISTKIMYDERYAYLRVKGVEVLSNQHVYCLHVPGHHNVLTNGIIAKQCEGDELCVILLMDALLNFSRSYLPSHRGATQDAPLVLTGEIIASEVDEMVFDMDVVWEYPLEFYEACLEYKDPREVSIEVLGNRLGKEGQYEGIGFTHDVSDINMGVRCSAYKLLPTMEEKLHGQMDLAEKIRAVNDGDVARLVIDRHFIRDIRGNLRKFSMQQFRCVNCNEKFRRPPLSGICNQCNGRIIFTISEGSITKYLNYCIELSKKYDIPSYLRQIIDLTKQRVESVFGKEQERQEGLGKWV